MPGTSPPPTESSPLLPDPSPTTRGGHDTNQEHTEPSNGQLLIILSGVYLGAFVAALDATLVATLSAPISTSFDNMPLLGWLASAFFIATTVSQPLAGKLTDIYGRQTGLILANVVFALGNLMCAAARSEWILLLGRVVAGLGGGGIAPIASFIMSDLVPLRKRGVWQGIGNICFGIGSGIGGPFGGWINDLLGWRWAFVVQIPVTMLAVALVASKVRLSSPSKADVSRLRRVDGVGAFLLSASLVLLLVGLGAGGNLLPWRHPLVISSLPLAAIMLAAFVFVETRIATEPILPVHLLLERTVAAACLTNWFMAMARFGLLFYVPIYFQVQGYSASATGLRLIPESIAIATTSLLCGLIMRQTGRYYWLSQGSQAVFVAGLALVASLRLDTSAWQPFVYLFCTGAGYSGMLTTTLLALISAVDTEYMAVTTSASYAFRSTGSVIGISIASAVFQNILRPQLRRRLAGVADADRLISRIEKSLGTINRLEPLLRDEVSHAYMFALRATFVTLLGLAFVGFVAGTFMRENKLHANLSRRASD